jgi:zona occludens toxin (predicted ATPase)
MKSPAEMHHACSQGLNGKYKAFESILNGCVPQKRQGRRLLCGLVGVAWAN